MEKDNVIIYISSRNNYDMFKGEVLKNINLEGYELINVDDNSSQLERDKGRLICSENGIVFLDNKDRGVQMATQTVIDFINENRPRCKWIICFQHDIYPISKNFFTTISEYDRKGSLLNFGIIGFNVLDHGDYTNNSLADFLKGKPTLGMIGMAHLSIRSNSGRWLCPKQQYNLINSGKFNQPFICEFPMWAAVGINVDLWNENIVPTNDYHFHLWLPDIAMQFNYKNHPSLIIPELYCLNNQALKDKYNINVNSATGAKAGDEYHFGAYSNFNAWKSRWGWDYENTDNFKLVESNYVDTLIGLYYNHNIMQNGPLQNYQL
jgi:hypothetical protein